MNLKVISNALKAITMGLILALPAFSGDVKLLNVSYDPTRELYAEYNRAFREHWKKTTGQGVTISQSHGGSGKQARSVIDGLDADVVSLALAYDIDAIAEKGQLLPKNWQSQLPNNSSPYTSTIVFLVRKGNPKGIKDWDDLVKPGIKIVMPNPKTSGGARWNYLAAWGFALKKYNGDSAKAYRFVADIYKRVPVLDAGARGATTTFVQRRIGDVLITWENEGLLAAEKEAKGKVELIVPSLSILAEPPVSVVEKTAGKHRNAKVAKGYLEYLYSEVGQEIVAKNYFRPREAKAAAKYAAVFPKTNLFTIDSVFGGWQKAHKVHFADKGVYDQIQKEGR